LEGLGLELSRIEELVIKLEALERDIQNYESRRAELEKTLEEYKRKSDVERRFHELAGIPYEDRSAELQEQLEKLRAEYENALLERDRLREEILKGISDIVIPMDRELTKASRYEITFPFRDGTEYPAIIRFIERELEFGQPPVYVTLTPSGVKVVGVEDEISAMQEVVKAIENLKERAKKKLELIPKPAGREEKPETPPPPEEPPIPVRIIGGEPAPEPPEAPEAAEEPEMGIFGILKRRGKK